MQIVYALLVFILIFGILYWATNSPSNFLGGNIPVSNVISHWSHFFQSFALSSDSFYSELEKSIENHKMPNSSISRTTHKEAGLLSASREYLRIKHGDIVFDVCAAPFGKDFFISWWLYESQGGMRKLLRGTKMGDFLKRRAAMRTFYQVDEEDMFRSCVHECILVTISKLTEDKPEYKLSETDKAFKMGGL